MNFREFEYLLALQREGNFSRAALRAGVSQPTLSTQIRKLESELGAPLLERTPSGIMLTPLGKDVAARADRILHELGEIRQVADRASDPYSAQVTMGMIHTLAPYLLPRALPSLRTRFPEVSFRFIEGMTAGLLSQLVKGELDATVIAEQPEVDGLDSQLVFKEDFVLAAPVGHPFLEGRDLDALQLADLRGEELLLLDQGHCLRDQALDLCERVGAHESTFAATSMETLRYMVAGGAGMTLLPRLAVGELSVQPETLQIAEFRDPKPHRELYLVWRESSPLTELMPGIAGALNVA